MHITSLQRAVLCELEFLNQLVMVTSMLPFFQTHTEVAQSRVFLKLIFKK